MGFVRERMGKVGVESRRESFFLSFDREEGHPLYKQRLVEVGYDEVEDTIAALRDLAMHDTRYQAWVAAGRRDPLQAEAEKVWDGLRPAQRLNLAESVERRGIASLLRLEKMRKAGTYSREPWSRLRDDERQAVACAIDNGWTP